LQYITGQVLSAKGLIPSESGLYGIFTLRLLADVAPDVAQR